jgi:hypothetical protein
MVAPMTEMVAHEDRPKRSNGEAHGPVLVSGAKLATHFGLSRQHVERLTAEGVIERRADGKFDQDVTHLRAEHRRSPRSQADTAFVAAKTAMLQLRLMEKKRELVRQDEVNEVIDGICGVTLTALSSMPARCAPRGDLAVRRAIERVVFEVRTEIAKVCQEMAEQCGEPPLDDKA